MDAGEGVRGLGKGGEVVCVCVMDDGRRIGADLFIDCTGFAALLLGKTLGEKYVSYQNELFCNSAIIGSYHYHSLPQLPQLPVTYLCYYPPETILTTTTLFTDHFNLPFNTPHKK